MSEFSAAVARLRADLRKQNRAKDRLIHGIKGKRAKANSKRRSKGSSEGLPNGGYGGGEAGTGPGSNGGSENTPNA